jgi:ABC-2 type transport system permease protein
VSIGDFYRLAASQATILRRNTSFWLASLVVAAISILVFGWLFNPGTARPFKVGVVDADQSETSRALQEAFASVELVDVVEGEHEAELAALDDGERGAVLVVPAGFESDLAGRTAQLEVFYNVSDDPTRTAYFHETVGGVVAAFNRTLGAESAFVLKESSVSTDDVRYIDFLIPGMIGMTIMYVNLGVGFLLVSWREQGILRRLGVTPLRPMHLISSQAASFGVLSVAQVALILAIGHFVFDVDIQGSFAALALTVGLGIGSMLAIGYILGSVLNTPTSVNAVVNLIALPMLFLGGSYFPLDPPSWLQPVVQAIPLTHLNDALREIVNRGGDASAVWTDWTILLAWAAAGLLVSVRLFRWQ